MINSSHTTAKDVLETKLHGTRRSAFLSEVFSNSGHFLIIKSISDIVLVGWQIFITDPTEYFLIFAMLVQAWYLSKTNANRFWGNLIGVALYTLIDIGKDKLEYFQNTIHVLFWMFSLIIATLQGLRFHGKPGNDIWIIPLESLVRTLMVVVFYMVLKTEYQLVMNWHRFLSFANTPHHKFFIWSMIFIGILLGFQSLQIARQKQQIQQTAQILRNMAEWGMGSHAVAAAVNNPEALDFHKCQRTILFMDMRGFTAWCEKTSPDIVAEILNNYYHKVEPAAAQYQPLKISFTGDEIMAIYPTPQQGIAAAIAMQKAAAETLSPYEIGAGCALHCGTVIEGLFGSEGVRTYTVIGDVVNTAKRLESATPSGQITISDAVYQATNKQLKVEPCEPILAKGKTAAIKAWRLI